MLREGRRDFAFIVYFVLSRVIGYDEELRFMMKTVKEGGTRETAVSSANTY